MLKDWDDVPYGAADCVSGHVTWENMVDYIKHSGSCSDDGGFTLYDDDDSTTIWFEFYENSIDFLEDRAIYINSDETYIGHGAGDNIGAGTFNTLIGNDAGALVTTGEKNVILGGLAGSATDVNIDNCVLIGYNAGKNNTQDNIVGIGFEALDNNTGASNTAIGYAAMDAAVTGADNTALGYAALGANTGGYSNTAIGTNALLPNTVGFCNVAVGHNAGGAANVGADNCVYIGVDAGKNNTADNLVAIGYQAGQSNQGLYNTFIGRLCAYNTTITGQANVFVGGYSAIALTSGEHNIATGSACLNGVTDGSNNVAIGSNAQKNNNVSNCVIIGNYAGENNATNDRLYINPNDSAFPLIYGEFDNDVVKFGDNNAYWFAQILHENGGGQVFLKECTTPTAQGGYGALYTKADNKLYFQSGDGNEHEVTIS